MGVIRIVPGFLIALSLSVAAQTSEVPLSKKQKLEALRKALSSGSSNVESATKTRVKEAVAPADYRARAFDELRPKETAYSSDPHPTLATVHTQKIEARDPIFYQGLQIGLTAQSYRPQGIMPLVTIGERDLSRLPGTVMGGLELRYMPFTADWFGHHSWGFRAAGSYAGQKVVLKGPSGKDLGPTKLHTVQSSAFVSQEWVLPSRPEWSFVFDVGAGHFDLIQTGQSSLAQASEGTWLGLLRVGPSYRMGSLWFNLSYEGRKPLTKSWARVSENAVLLGVQYGIR